MNEYRALANVFVPVCLDTHNTHLVLRDKRPFVVRVGTQIICIDYGSIQGVAVSKPCGTQILRSQLFVSEFTEMLPLKELQWLKLFSAFGNDAFVQRKARPDPDWKINTRH